MERNENGLFDYNISCRNNGLSNGRSQNNDWMNGRSQNNDWMNGRSQNNDWMNGRSQNNDRMNERNRGRCNMGDDMEVMPEVDMNCSEEQLAMVYSPYQCFRMLYPADKGLARGTLFEELDKPLEDCRNG